MVCFYNLILQQLKIINCCTFKKVHKRVLASVAFLKIFNKWYMKVKKYVIHTHQSLFVYKSEFFFFEIEKPILSVTQATYP